MYTNSQQPSTFAPGGRNIDAFHPLLWGSLAALSLPVALLAGSILFRLAGQTRRARSLLRLLGYVLSTEILLLAILALAGFAYERHARQRDNELYGQSRTLVDVGGYRLHLNCRGEGSPMVVLEYGLQGSYLDWYAVEPEIARFTRVCIYDRAGYGWSDPSPRPRIPSVMAEELHTLLHAAGEKPPFILTAHSYGSFPAVMFAHLYPSEVSGLVLADGLHTFSTFPFGLREKLSLRSMQLLVPVGVPRLRHWFGGNMPPELQGERQAIGCRPGFYDAIYRERAALPESVAEMRAIPNLGSVPLIAVAHDPKILSGKAGLDEWSKVQQQKSQLSTNSELVVALGSGHDIPADRPDVIVVSVKKLAFRLPAPAGSRGTP